MEDKLKGRALGAILFETQMVTQEDIEHALAEQKRTGQRFGEILVSLGIVTTSDVHWSLSKQLDLPFVRVRTSLIDPDAVAAIPAAFARRHRLLPYLLIEDELTVVVADPTNHKAVAELAELTGKRVVVGIALESEIAEGLEYAYGGMGESAVVADLVSDWLTDEEIEAWLIDSTGAAFLNGLLTKAADTQELDFDPGDPFKVRLRTAGRSRIVAEVGPAWMHVISRRLHKSLRNKVHQGQRTEGRLAVPDGDGEKVFHVACVDTFGGEAITLANLSLPPLAASLTDLAPDPASWPSAGRGLWIVTGHDCPEKWQLIRMLADAVVQPETKAVHIGSKPYLGGAPLLRIRPDGDSPSARDAAFLSALGVSPDVMFVDDIVHGETLNLCLREAAAGRLVIAAASFTWPWTTVEYLLEKAASRVVLGDALAGLIHFTAVESLPADAYEADDRIELAAKLLGLPTDAIAAGSLRRPAGETDPAPGRPLVVTLPLDEKTATAIKAGRSITEIAAGVRDFFQEPLLTALRGMVLSGEVSLDQYQRATGSTNHG